MTAATAGHASRPRLRIPALVPDRQDALDAAFLAGLSVLALIGFHPAYGSAAYLVVAGVAFILGLVLAQVTNRTRQPIVVVVVATLVLFFLVGGGVALRDVAGGGGLPTPSAFHALAGTAVHGWSELLTSVHPVGGTGPLLVIPYLLGMFVAIAGFSVARRSTSPLAPLAPPAAVLALSILFGPTHPAAAVVQGAVFAVAALTWAAVRNSRRRTPTLGSHSPLVRLGTAAAVLAVAFLAAWGAGPHLPFSHHARVVLKVEPPFDAAAYPSPLASYRQYTKNAARPLYGSDLLTVTGLPANTFLQIAVLDDYDGAVWGVADGSDGPADSFVRVGHTIPTSGQLGSALRVGVTVDQGYRQVWLPDAGGLSSLTFRGPRAAELGTSLRYDAATGTGIAAAGLQPGDAYDMTVHARPLATLDSLKQQTPATSPQVSGDATSIVAATANSWAQGATSPVAAVAAVAGRLQSSGFYSDGLNDGSGSVAGHDTARLVTFLQGRQIVGDDEQYAATFALMADQQGVPARVVLGAIPANGLVKGQDVRATVQLDLAGPGWVTLDPNAFTPPKTKAPQPLPREVEKLTQPKVVPPALGTKPLTTDVTPNQSNADADRPKTKHHGGALLPTFVVTILTYAGIPLLGLAVIAGGIVGAKTWRRRRRRTGGSPADRVAAAWQEALDVASDHGHRTAMVGTRREIVAALPAVGLEPVATAADQVVFGAGDIDADTAAEVWLASDQTRRALRTGLGRRQRWRAALSLRTFHPPRLTLPTLRRPALPRRTAATS